MYLFCIIGYALLSIYEFVPLYKQKLWTDFWVNTVLTTVSFVIAILLCFNVKIPSPQAPIGMLVTSIFGK